MKFLVVKALVQVRDVEYSLIIACALGKVPAVCGLHFDVEAAPCSVLYVDVKAHAF